MKGTLARTIASVACVGVFLFLAAGSQDTARYSPSSSVGSPSNRQLLMKEVKLDFNWRKVGFDNIMEADFIINNPTEHSFKDFEITCRHFAKSGTEIDRNRRTIYEVVNAHSKKVVRKFNMGFIHSQAASSGCEITDLVPLN